MYRSSGKKYIPPRLTIWGTRQTTGRAFGREYMIPRIDELIDVPTLQHIQDWAAETAGVPILIRDAEGLPVTNPSMSSEFCDLIAGEDHTNEECRKSNAEAAAIAARTGRPQKYTCHAGLVQFAAPILVEGQLVGTIVIGDRPMEPLKPEEVEELAAKFGVERERLMKAAEAVEIWSEETMNSTINFLYSMANALFNLCYQGYELSKNVNELTVLLEISELLTSVLGVQEVLDRIARGIVEALGFKACTIRLLDDDAVELVLKSLYNLSDEYLSKGPVILEKHPVCQEAMKGEAVVIDDVSVDPRFGYHAEARREGLHSMLCVGLISKDTAIGTIHLYTGEPHNFTEDEIKLVQSIANHAAVAIVNAKLYEESIEKQRIEQELALAGEIQAELLPSGSPDLESIDIEAKIVPHGQLSGDLYDFIKLGDQRMGVVIADVSGKGTPGAILMATTRAITRMQAELTITTAETISKVNLSLCEDTRPTEFVSMFYGVLDTKTDVLTYTNAGHNPPILFHGDETIFLEEGGVPLGIIENTPYGEARVKLAPGDVILFYTDGVTEATDDSREIFGLERLMHIARKNLALDARELIDVIYNEVVDFVGGAPQSDDLTLMALRVTDLRL